MSLADDLSTKISGIISTTWNLREGQVVPSTDTVALSGGAVELDATYLYADLANSSKMAKEFDRRVVAKILKSFLMSATTCVHQRGGTVISFDGDRILGVFVGDLKNTSAARCALNINFAVTQLIKPKFEASYQSVRDASFEIGHACGVDTGKVLVVRGGVRGTSDLISIGRGPNLAAKLSDVREDGFSSYITKSVFSNMAGTSKVYEGQNMWEPRNFNHLGEPISIYRSGWWLNS